MISFRTPQTFTGCFGLSVNQSSVPIAYGKCNTRVAIGIDFFRKWKGSDGMRKRNHAVTVRMSDAEYQMLCEKVNVSGQTQQAVIIDAIKQVPIVSKEHLKELITTNQNFAEYNKQLRGIATNINQMAHHANAQGALPVKEYLATILELVMDMRKEGNQLWQLIRQSISRQNRMEP